MTLYLSLLASIPFARLLAARVASLNPGAVLSVREASPERDGAVREASGHFAQLGAEGVSIGYRDPSAGWTEYRAHRLAFSEAPARLVASMYPRPARIWADSEISMAPLTGPGAQ